MRNKFGLKNRLYAAVVGITAGTFIVSGSINAQESGRVDEPRSELSVQDRAPHVDVNQPAPEVNVEQQDAQVDVRTGEPQIAIDQPEPQVEIEQPEPEVSIQQAEPQVTVNTAEPEVHVEQEEPEVTIEKSEPNINIVRQSAEGEEQSAHQTSATLMHADLESLEGKTVVNSEGDRIGTVEDIVLSRDGGEVGFVVSAGGFFGIGDSEIVVPASDSHLEEDDIVYRTSRDADELKDSVKYQEERYQAISGRFRTLSEAQEAP